MKSPTGFIEAKGRHYTQFLNLYGASQSTVEEVREEERKLNLELNALGEFIRKWGEFEQALLDKCNKVSPGEIKERRASVTSMLHMLLKHEAISGHFFQLARYFADMRNSIVHGHQNFPLPKIRNAIESLDELMDEL